MNTSKCKWSLRGIRHKSEAKGKIQLKEDLTILAV